MSEIHQRIGEEIDAVASEVRNFKAAAHEIIELHRKIGDAISKAGSSLRVIQSKAIIQRDTKLMDKIQTLQDSVDRIHESRNRMDLGTFVVRTDRVMDEVYQALP